MDPLNIIVSMLYQQLVHKSPKLKLWDFEAIFLKIYGRWVDMLWGSSVFDSRNLSYHMTNCCEHLSLSYHMTNCCEHLSWFKQVCVMKFKGRFCTDMTCDVS